MEELSKIDKFVIAYLWHEYFGAVYYQSGREEPEEFLAKQFLEGLVDPSKRHYLQLVKKIASSLKKLQEYWIIQLSGYELKLTDFGLQLAKQIPKEEYEKLKEEVVKGKI